MYWELGIVLGCGASDAVIARRLWGITLKDRGRLNLLLTTTTTDTYQYAIIV